MAVQEEPQSSLGGVPALRWVYRSSARADMMMLHTIKTISTQVPAFPQRMGIRSIHAESLG